MMQQSEMQRLRRKWSGELLLEPSWMEVGDELLGQGGSAKVFRGVYNGQLVAVKRYLNEGRISVLEREVDMMRRLKHANVMPLVGVYEREGGFDVVTPLAVKGNLSNLIHHEGISDERLKLKIAEGIAKGLEYLHRHGIVHGDLKPENVLLDENFAPIISDFGLSWKVRVLSSIHKRQGTYRYMAPEVMKRRSVTAKADVYSLAVLLCELFTGRVPYGEGSSSKRSAMQATYKTLRPNLHGIRSPFIVALIEECWANDPSRRPHTKSVVRGLTKLTQEPSSSSPKSGKLSLSSFLKSPAVGALG